MMYEELVRDLRENHDKYFARDMAAADAIAELSRENESLAKSVNEASEILRKRWIPVTEGLPVGGDDSGAVCENVCLMMDDGTVSCGWMNGITKKVYYLNARDDFIIKAPITRVTHWMPLPEPPSEVAK